MDDLITLIIKALVAAMDSAYGRGQWKQENLTRRIAAVKADPPMEGLTDERRAELERIADTEPAPEGA